MFKKWQLQDWANLAQVLSLLGLPLSVALWYFTREHLKKFWQKWRWAVFIALGVAAFVGAAFRGWFAWLAHPVTLHVWVLILVVVIPPALLFLTLWLISKVQESSTPVERSWKDYTTDRIFNVAWTWRYGGYSVQDSLTAYCPRGNCKCRLAFEDDYGRAGYGRVPVTLVCPNCGLREHFDFDSETLRNRVGIEIERRIRTGEYERSFALQSSAS